MPKAWRNYQIVSGEDVLGQLTAGMAAALDPEETNGLRTELKDVWLSDSVELVIRKQIGNGVASAYRIRKGSHAMLITYRLNNDAKVTLFADAPDQEYQ